jgi:NAD(P)-dependent dehydrogenase (short-subunit alcohol dehydrogenase family)
VLIASRNRNLSDDAVRRIGNESGAGAAAALDVDLGSTASIRKLAAEIATRDVPLRALVCNAGLQQLTGKPRISADGFELTFAVNHLGHFLLANLLLDRLGANAPARIVVVASGVHDPKLKTGMPKALVGDLDTLARTGGAHEGQFDGRLAYVNSKLCNVWFTYELARRIEARGLRGVTVNAFDPGLVPGSGLARDYPPALRFAWERVLPGIAGVVTRFVPSVSTREKSGAALARLVLDPALGAVTGKYFPSHARWQDARSSDASYDVVAARALWEKSVELTGLGQSTSASRARSG